jgi:undecaprenyl-diphosphatase
VRAGAAVSAFLAPLAAADRALLLKVNRAWTSAFLDASMPFVTNLFKAHWFLYGAGPALLALWIWKGRRRALQVIVVAALAAGTADFVAYHVLKPWVARPRPEYTVSEVDVRVPNGGRYGFPSNHAANSAAAAAVLSAAYPAGAPAFIAAAAIVGYSRVYVGAHYPADVLAGWLLGAALGWLWAALLLERGAAAKKKRR